MGLKGCLHLEHFIKEKGGLKTYRVLHGVFVISGSEERRELKQANAYCYVCTKRHFLHVCLHCTFFGCGEHIREHSKNKKHTFAMEISYGQVYCSQCRNYTYDEELDDIARDNALQGDSFNKSVLELVWPNIYTEDSEWCNKAEKMVIDKSTHIGLRGLLNLGSTCFMNCVVQAMTHTPVLRDYFFTEHHQCKDTQAKKCLISNLFRDFYTGEKTPIVLHEFLNLIWTKARHLAGYEQQDAHEFFIATLNVFHTHCSDTLPPQPNAATNKIYRCSCIIDQVFTGSLQSDVVCQKCNGVSTTIDPMWDYSLDLTPSVAGGCLPTSLEECLERFTGAEILGSNSKIFCESCKANQESTKQFTMRTLPVVFCFHLKRFQHLKDHEKKVSTRIRFPELLDMTPFMTKQSSDSAFHLTLPNDNKYVLYAVINHMGSSINAGHYISYIRYQDRFWYKCDDLIVSEAGIEEVLSSEGYLLFYYKCCLEYR